jgi:hypothetical protein
MQRYFPRLRKTLFWSDMLNLNLMQWSSALRILPYQQSVRTQGATQQVFDSVRRRWVALTPEEMVRQLLIQYFIQEHHFPLSRMSVERKLVLHGMTRRYDLVLFDKKATPLLLAECKGPTIPLNQDVLDQAARYNLELKVPYLFVTNGRQSYCCRIDLQNLEFLEMPVLN